MYALHSEDWVMEGHFHPWYEFNYVASGAAHSHRNYNRRGDDGFCLRWQMEKVGTDAPHSKAADEIIKVLSAPPHL